MADFCAECSIRLFGVDTHDMKGSATAEDTANGYFTPVLCEDCGDFILVDHEGIRVSSHEHRREIVDGVEKEFWAYRPEEEMARARAFVAMHQEEPDADAEPCEAFSDAAPDAAPDDVPEGFDIDISDDIVVAYLPIAQPR
jgi:hypothetical protein